MKGGKEKGGINELQLPNFNMQRKKAELPEPLGYTREK